MKSSERLESIKYINEFERANAHKLEKLKTRRYRDKKFVDTPKKWAWYRYEFLMNLDGVDFCAVIDEYGNIIEMFNRETLETFDIGEGTEFVIDNEIVNVVQLIDLST